MPKRDAAEVAIDEPAPKWTARGWVEHCRSMAGRCREIRPDLAKEWDRRAAAVAARYHVEDETR